MELKGTGEVGEQGADGKRRGSFHLKLRCPPPFPLHAGLIPRSVRKAGAQVAIRARSTSQIGARAGLLLPQGGRRLRVGRDLGRMGRKAPQGPKDGEECAPGPARGSLPSSSSATTYPGRARRNRFSINSPRDSLAWLSCLRQGGPRGMEGRASRQGRKVDLASQS